MGKGKRRETSPDEATAIKDFHGTDNERKRATFLLVFLQTRSESLAEKTSGASRMELGRIIESLKKHGDIRELPRSGRPPIYSEAVNAAAYRALVEWEEGYPTGPTLMAKLVDDGVIKKAVDVDIMLQHLKQYVKGLGHILIVDSTKTTFFLTAGDVVVRVKFAHKMIAALQGRTVDMIIYVDETTLEESPHPKGEEGRGLLGGRMGQSIGIE
jgi:hypothetical protein